MPARAVVYDADGQPVCIRMPSDLEHLAHDDIAIDGREPLERVDLEPRRREISGDALRVNELDPI
jgi:hypothetical protein